MSPKRMVPAGRKGKAPKSSAREAGPDVAALDRFLCSIGIDPRRDPTYAGTAKLAAQLLADRTAGLRGKFREPKAVRYRGRSGESVAVEEIPVYGLCPHHLVPYFGEAQVRYAPRKKVCGPGSLARLVRDLATIPRIQEDLTQAIADHVQRALDPRMVEVVVRARHLCAEMRGVEQKVQFVTEARRAARR